MSVAIRVALQEGRYEAGGLNPHVVEWPPHPARLHCALVAGAISPAHAQILRLLESQPAPQVWADLEPMAVTETVSYVVTNKVEAKGSNLFHPARTSKERRRVSATLERPAFAMCWPDLTLDPIALAVLEELAARVPYVGRSTSSALLTVHTEPLEPVDGWVRWEPTVGDEPAETELRVTYPGYTEALDEAYAHDSRAWEVSDRVCGYRTARVGDSAPEESRLEIVPSPYDRMLVFGFPRGLVHIDGTKAGAVTDLLRKAVMSRLDDPLPAQISGHGADQVPHVAYLPLLDVGHRYARGHVLGVALALPRCSPDVVAAVQWGLLGQTDPLTLQFGDVSLRLQGPGQRRDRDGDALSPHRWTKPSRRFATVTPMVLDRFCGPKGVADEIARAAVGLGLPEPVDVVAGRGPMIAGGAALRRHQLPRRDSSPRPWTHAVVEFPTPVSGPLLMGAQRYLGMGMFAPLPDREDATGV